LFAKFKIHVLSNNEELKLGILCKLNSKGIYL
jgi:hypothetical protein